MQREAKCREKRKYSLATGSHIRSANTRRSAYSRNAAQRWVLRDTPEILKRHPEGLRAQPGKRNVRNEVADGGGGRAHTERAVVVQTENSCELRKTLGGTAYLTKRKFTSEHCG